MRPSVYSLRAPITHMNFIKRIFVGPNGIRAGWRLLMFLTVSQVIVKLLYAAITRFLGYKEPDGWYARDFILEGVLSMAALLAAGELMRRISGARFVNMASHCKARSAKCSGWECFGGLPARA
jgi:hypothetical protein